MILFWVSLACRAELKQTKQNKTYKQKNPKPPKTKGAGGGNSSSRAGFAKLRKRVEEGDFMERNGDYDKSPPAKLASTLKEVGRMPPEAP